MKYKDKKYLLIIFSITAFVIRLLPWKYTIVDNGKWVVFLQPDAYYHLRRATIWAQNFPKIITLDYYMSYPFGAECPWPPLYDWFIAVLSLILGLGKYDAKMVHLVTALLPPVIASLCIIATYMVVKRVWKNDRIALFASFFAIIMPGMLGYSTVASGDHHIAETFVGLLFYYYALKIVEDSKDQKIQNKDILITGLLISVGLLVWQGEIVFYTIFAFFLIVFFLLNNKKIGYINKVSVSFLYIAFIGSSVVALIRFIIPRATSLSLFDFGYFSYFQPVYITFVFSCVFVFGKIIQIFNTNIKKFIAISSIVVSGFIIIIFFLKPLREGIWLGLNFLFKTDPWHSSINEFQSTFTINQLKSSFYSVEGLINIGYFLSFILPFIYSMIYSVRYVREKNKMFYVMPYDINIRKIDKIVYIKNTEYNYINGRICRKINDNIKNMSIFFIVVATSFFFLAIYQKRWTNSYSPILAMGLALFTNTIYMKIKKGHSFFKEYIYWRSKIKKDKVGPITRLIFLWEKSPIVFSILIIIFILMPYYIIVSEIVIRKGYGIESDVYNSLQWMRIYTPKTSHLYKPDKKPEYGVLSQWDMGHFIQYIAERPTIVNNFGHQLPGDGFKTALYVWSIESEDELKNILDRYQVRYLILTDPVVYMNNSTKEYLKKGFVENSIEFVPAHFGASIPYPKDEFFKYPLPNLWVFDGSSNGFRSAAKNFRLVFESQNPNYVQYFEDREIKKIKIFEYVKGCKIKGKANPRDIIYIRGEFVTNFDRYFEWEAAAIANDNGEFEGILPYATSEDNLFVKPLSPYYFFTKEKMYRIYTTNDDVEKGNEITVDLTKGDNIPDIMKNEVKEKISSLAGKVKSKSYIKIHRKLNEK